MKDKKEKSLFEQLQEIKDRVYGGSFDIYEYRNPEEQMNKNTSEAEKSASKRTDNK